MTATATTSGRRADHAGTTGSARRAERRRADVSRGAREQLAAATSVGAWRSRCSSHVIRRPVPSTTAWSERDRRPPTPTRRRSSWTLGRYGCSTSSRASRRSTARIPGRAGDAARARSRALARPREQRRDPANDALGCAGVVDFCAAPADFAFALQQAASKFRRARRPSRAAELRRRRLVERPAPRGRDTRLALRPYAIGVGIVSGDGARPRAQQRVAQGYEAGQLRVPVAKAGSTSRAAPGAAGVQRRRAPAAVRCRAVSQSPATLPPIAPAARAEQATARSCSARGGPRQPLSGGPRLSCTSGASSSAVAALLLDGLDGQLARARAGGAAGRGDAGWPPRRRRRLSGRERLGGSEAGAGSAGAAR